MKKIIILGVFFALFAYISAFGQTITGNCSQVIVTNEGFIPPRTKPNEPLIQVNAVESFTTRCQWIAFGFDFLPNVRFILEKKVNNVFSYQGLQDNNPTFSNLSSGTYRVRIQHFLEEQGSCVSQPFGTVKNGPFDVLTINGGKVGVRSEPLPAQQFTNEVVVGVPTLGDNQWSFLNDNNNLILASMFDPAEGIRIDARGNRNFDRYGVAIQEFWPGNIPGNYRSLAWRLPNSMLNGSGLIDNAQRPLGIENLRELWDPTGTNTNWVFVPGNTYRVQVTISNSNCASWVDNLQTFLVCYPSWGCREGVAQAKVEPSISPNPVSRTFKIDGIEFNPVPSLKDELNIYDLTGRLVKNFKTIQANEFDVSDLSTGVYFVSVLRDEHKLFTKKLMVSH